MNGPIDRLRKIVVNSGRSMLWAERFPGEQYTDPPGDKGLFGPDSPVWQVHSDTSMFVGGLSAILVQMLHPLAMAGVAEHSDWVTQPIRRLSRTASFITATSFASTPVADSIIGQVRRTHARVTGTAPNGRAYCAGDPELLRWVHTAQVSSFLRAHLRYHPHPIGPAEQDRYYREVAEVARRLGGRDLPADRAEVSAYFDSIQSELEVGPQARQALVALRQLRPGGYGQTIAYRIVLSAAADLSPAWAQMRLGFGGSRAALRITPWLLAQLRKARGTPDWLQQARIRCAA